MTESLRGTWEALGPAARLSQDQADQVVQEARPRALDALGRGGESPEALRATAKLVAPSAQRGGSIIPAWPGRRPDGSVLIELVEDWGVMLANWRAVAARPPGDMNQIDALLRSRQRLWVGVANDVLQMYVVDPPLGTYSMIRHHGLMLAAATLWLGPDAVRAWQAAHLRAAAAFLANLNGLTLWEGIGRVEKGLGSLLDDRRAQGSASEVLAWLESDADARGLYQDYLGAASLGVEALLALAPETNADAWLRDTVRDQHPDPDFNRLPIEALARRIQA